MAKSEATLVREALDVFRSHRALHHLPANDLRALIGLLTSEADARDNLAAYLLQRTQLGHAVRPSARILAVAAIRQLGEAHPAVISADLYPCCASATFGEHIARFREGRCNGLPGRSVPAPFVAAVGRPAGTRSECCGAAPFFQFCNRTTDQCAAPKAGA